MTLTASGESDFPLELDRELEALPPSQVRSKKAHSPAFLRPAGQGRGASTTGLKGIALETEPLLLRCRRAELIGWRRLRQPHAGGQKATAVCLPFGVGHHIRFRFSVQVYSYTSSRQVINIGQGWANLVLQTMRKSGEKYISRL